MIRVNIDLFSKFLDLNCQKNLLKFIFNVIHRKSSNCSTHTAMVKKSIIYCYGRKTLIWKKRLIIWYFIVYVMQLCIELHVFLLWEISRQIWALLFMAKLYKELAVKQSSSFRILFEWSLYALYISYSSRAFITSSVLQIYSDVQLVSKSRYL